jgi:hypothetical protein
MLKARWHGYEIDSSEAAYEAAIPPQEKLGTIVRGLLTSGYFVRSYYLIFEEPLVRLRDFIVAQGDGEDKDTAKTLEYLEKQIAKFKPDSYKVTTIGVRAVESILNYVSDHRQKLLKAGTFRFELTPEQIERLEDYGYDEEFEPGGLVEESDYYSEEEIPLDGVVLFLGCSLVPAGKLAPGEQKKAYELVRASYASSGLLDELQGWGSFLGKSRDYVAEDIGRRKNLSLRVRIDPDASFTITGRWFDDGQFVFPYYGYLLGLAAKKARAEIETYYL